MPTHAGLRIYRDFPRPDPALVEAFRGIPASVISDDMNRFFCVDAQIEPMNAAPLLGTAFTLRSSTADNLMIHAALELAKPGDVIVVDVQGDLGNAVVGELVLRYAMSRGIGGFLVDGAVRDVGAIRTLPIPVYARGVTPKGPYKDGPGEINVPVVCGGVPVNPGDIVVGDEDGVVIVRRQDAAEVLRLAQARVEEEAASLAAIEAGTADKSWAEAVLKAKGYRFFDFVDND